MGYSKTQDTIILNNHTITTEYYEHKEEAFNSYLDEHFSHLESTITSLQPYAKNIHVKIYDDAPSDAGNFTDHNQVTTETYGNHSMLDGIEVNIYSTGSFIHELGHHIDKSNVWDTFQMFSEEEAFRPLFEAYSNEFDKYLDTVDVSEEQALQARQYYLTPTEVFARTFQRWYNERFEGNIWTIDTHMGPGERIVNAVDFEIIDDYFCSTLKDLKVEKLNDLDFANKIQNIDTKVNEYVP